MTNPLTPAQQAMLDNARAEHLYLRQSQAEDGFELGEIETSTVTDEEFTAFFPLNLDGRTLVFTYSLGFDVDENGYAPYAHVSGGDVENPEQFSTKVLGDMNYARDQDELLASVRVVGHVAGNARFEGFQWLMKPAENQTQKPRAC